VWDDEGSDRCFLIVGGKGQFSLRITLFEEDIKMLKEAVLQLQSDL